MPAAKEKKTNSKKSTENGSKRKNYYILTGIIVLTFLLYAKSIHNGFLNWDDDDYVCNNPDIQNLTADAFHNLWTKFYVGCYLPLTMMTYAFEFKNFGLNATGYHFDNTAHSFN